MPDNEWQCDWDILCSSERSSCLDPPFAPSQFARRLRSSAVEHIINLLKNQGTGIGQVHKTVLTLIKNVIFQHLYSVVQVRLLEPVKLRWYSAPLITLNTSAGLSKSVQSTRINIYDSRLVQDLSMSLTWRMCGSWTPIIGKHASASLHRPLSTLYRNCVTLGASILYPDSISNVVADSLKESVNFVTFLELFTYL